MHSDGRIEVLIPRQSIAQRVRELAEEIARHYNSELLIVPVLSGSIVFLSDLIRHLPLRMKIGLIGVCSYAGVRRRSVGPTVLQRLDYSDVRGRDVLIVDDILDSGRTLQLVREEMVRGGAASVAACVLLRKDTARAVDVEVQYVGFDIPDVFVVGYGLDYDGYYRNLPDVAILNEPSQKRRQIRL